jgi:hypothetical protein
MLNHTIKLSGKCEKGHFTAQMMNFMCFSGRVTISLACWWSSCTRLSLAVRGRNYCPDDDQVLTVDGTQLEISAALFERAAAELCGSCFEGYQSP